jgi:ferrous iron transport protein B
LDVLQWSEVSKLVESKSSDEIIADYTKISEIAKLVLSTNSSGKPRERSSAFDRYLLHPIFGYLAFFVIMGGLFTSIYWLATPAMDAIDAFFGLLQDTVSANMAESLFQDFLVNGIIGGVGAILVFLPQIVILFILMGLLEDSGYLARAAVLIDAPLLKIGLSGRSFVPMLSGFACAIPALMSARTIKNPTERYITLFIIPLMACSARLPVFTILLSLVSPADKPWIGGFGLLTIYIVTILFSSLVAFIIHKFKRGEEQQQFALELPKYRVPYFKTTLKTTVEKSKAYLRDAGTVILVISSLMWAMATFPQESAENPNQQSILEQLGHTIEPALAPMGLEWRSGVAIISSFAAREVFVSSLIQVYRVSESDDFEDESIREALLQKLRDARHGETGEKIFTFSTIMGLIIFYIFALMCFPTVSVAKREFGNWVQAITQFVVLTSAGYLLAIVAVQSLRFFGIA